MLCFSCRIHAAAVGSTVLFERHEPVSSSTESRPLHMVLLPISDIARHVYASEPRLLWSFYSSLVDHNWRLQQFFHRRTSKSGLLNLSWNYFKLIASVSAEFVANHCLRLWQVILPLGKLRKYSNEYHVEGVERQALVIRGCVGGWKQTIRFFLNTEIHFLASAACRHFKPITVTWLLPVQQMIFQDSRRLRLLHFGKYLLHILDEQGDIHNQIINWR